MVSSKKTHCAYCQKKCSGNVLRYQDRYYHKPCFELEQQASSASRASLAIEQQQQQQQQHQHQMLNPQVSESSQAASRYTGSAGPTQPTGAMRSRTLDARQQPSQGQGQQELARSSPQSKPKSSTLPHAQSAASNGHLSPRPSSPLESKSHHQQQKQKQSNLNNSHNKTSTICAGCRERISDGQALIALDLHWHVWCFKCAQCKSPLHGEYVAKEGRAYCEKDYQRLFGIACVYCKRYITGKVLQAGEAHHFHPSCARCSKCGDPFVPGEEMYLQGEVTWHPRCGPGPNGAPLAGESELRVPRVGGGGGAGGHSPSLGSGSRSRSASPFSYVSSRHHHHHQQQPSHVGGQYDGHGARATSPSAATNYAESEPVGDLSRVYTISYLNSDPNQGYLRRPIEPYPPKSPQFSRPQSLSRLGGGGGGAASDRSRCSSRSQQYIYGAAAGAGGSSVRERSMPRGMYSMLSGMRGDGSSVRARSPSMMNEEAIALASYPSGQKPAPDSVAPVERDDFPAPPFPYPDRHHAHHHHHRSYTPTSGKQQVPPADSEMNLELAENGYAQETHSQIASKQKSLQQQERASRPRSREIVLSDGTITNGSNSTINSLDSDGVDANQADTQFRKEEEELSKIANGIGKIFLQTLKEREKLRAWKRSNLDPRNASRTPSATRELPARLRYENPTNASPSRDLDRARAAGWDEHQQQQQQPDADGEQSPTRTRSSLGRSTGLSHTLGHESTAPTSAPSALSSSYGYKVAQSNRSTPRPGYGLTSGPYNNNNNQATTGPGVINATNGHTASDLSFAEQQRVAQSRAADLLGRGQMSNCGGGGGGQLQSSRAGSMRSLASSVHFRRSMPNVAQLQGAGAAGSATSHHHHHNYNPNDPPKLYPYHLLATSNYRLPPGVDRCHLERHLSNEEFQYIFHCDRLDFYRLPEWKRNELKRRARLF